ncbi:MAG: hypothetical protein HY815_20925 [Candidatus Riflebacteria bacterium]|nr:hypothetical protein [Candidatus Riflebacteria bacterium]
MPDRWAGIAYRLALLLLSTLPLPGTAAAPPSTAPSQAARQALQEPLRRAVELIKARQFPRSLKIIDEVLQQDPSHAQARLVRAKVYLRLGWYDAALADAERVVREQPTMKGAAKVLQQARADMQANTVVVSGGPARYSEWDRVWTIPGKSPFAPGEFKGAEGHTLFYFAVDAARRDEYEAYLTDVEDHGVYFLRIVDLKGDRPAADLGLPGATVAKVDKVPYLILIDQAGAQVGRGEPGAVAPLLENLRAEARAKKARPVAGDPSSAKVDVSTSGDSFESLGSPGSTTVIMVTSPG